MKVSIVSGSPRKQSVTARVARFLQKYLSEENASHEYQIIYMSDYKLPYVEKVWSTPNDAPEEFRGLAEKIFATDAFILITPEYNGGYSPAMKNMLDHFPKQARKVFGIVTASPGIMGGIRASQQMQNLVAALFAIASPYMLIVGGVDKKFDAEGNLIDQAFINAIRTFTTEFIWLAETIFHSNHCKPDKARVTKELQKV